ncbi:MAG: heavy metal translocating P-type ATPase [Limisphaerales bacterium]
MSSTPPQKPDTTDTRCLVKSVAGVLAAEPALEAVTIDHASGRVSVATLAAANPAAVTERIDATIREIQSAGEQCGLLEGAVDCDHCELPSRAGSLPGLRVVQEGDRTTISRVTCPTAPKFWRWRDFPLPRVVPREVEIPEDEAHLNEWKWQLLAAGVCGVLALMAWLWGERPYALAFHLAAYLAGGWFAAEEVWERLRHRILDVHFLMLAVAVGSASIGKWEEGATLLFLFALSGALEHYAMGRTQREIRALFRHAPKVATTLDAQGRESEVAVDQLRAGQRLLLKPGDQFPVDAEVVLGRTAADESNLTGEATPVEKGPGDTVLAGTINLQGAIEALVLRPASESALEKIIRLIREAQHLKAPSQRFTDRFGTGYTYGILGLVLAMFFVWWLGLGLEPFQSTGSTRSAFYQAMTLLVVASPCALVLSIPSAVLAAIAWGARRGVLFRGGAAVENLAEVTVVAMDKTGTLTTGELQVEKVESFPPGRESETARLAFSLEKLSSHPLARAITRHGKQQQIAPLELTGFESITGMGLKARGPQGEVRLGRREWIASELAARGDRAAGERLAAVPFTDASHSEVWLAGGELLGRVLLSDAIRPQAKAVVEELRRLGLQTVVLTGDRPAAAQTLKTALGLDDVRAGLKPEDKVQAIVDFNRQGRLVAMVGDGVNDAPSLAAAHVGVAMGARGSDAALEQAEIVLMNDRLENFLAAFRLSQRARAIIRQNLVISLGTVVVLVGFALFGAIPLTLGVIGHEGSTVVVVLNSLRLLWNRPALA